MVERQLEFDLRPRIPTETALEYHDKIKELMDREDISVTYSGHNEKTGISITAYNTWDCSKNVTEAMQLYGDGRASMDISVQCMFDPEERDRILEEIEKICKLERAAA